MDKTIIVFSGMPASGKDTITELLCGEEGSNYVAFEKHRSFKNESEKKDTYVNITEAEFAEKEARGDFLQSHSRYDRYYGIDRFSLRNLLEDNKIPIIHIGRIENYYKFKDSLEDILDSKDLKCRIIHILLWEKQEVLEKRIREREQSDIERKKKIEAVHQELQDNKEMLDRNENPYSYIIKNDDKQKTCDAIKQIIKNNDCDLGTGFVEFMTYVLQTHDLNLEGQRNNTNTVSIRCKNEIANYKIKNRSFERNVTIESIGESSEHTELKFEDCIFNNLKLSEISCTSITFVGCTVLGELRIYKGNIENINIRSCENINKVVIEEASSSTEKIALNVTASKIGELKIDSTAFGKLSFKDANSSCELIRFVREGNADILKIGCLVNKIIIKELPIIWLKGEGTIESVEVEGIDKKLLRTYEKGVINNNKTGHIDDDLERYKSIILATYESFEERKMFAESDVCLFEIRRLGVLINKTSKSILVKIPFSIEQFFVEKCFGWGIRIWNNILTMMAVLITFAGVYFGASCQNEETKLKFIKCFEISLNRFFLIGSDEFNYAFLGYFESLESIMGVILLTVITGVLVRKIIR